MQPVNWHLFPYFHVLYKICVFVYYYLLGNKSSYWFNDAFAYGVLHTHMQTCSRRHGRKVKIH